jgi:hypothetical protein
MTDTFDASSILNEEISAEVSAQQAAKVADLMQRPTALANVRLHAENDMIRMAMACNRTAWGTIYVDPRKPTAEEAAALLASLASDAREKLIAEARATDELRALIARIAEAQADVHSRLEAEQAEVARREALIAEWMEFEQHDAATKEERFLAWRTARAGA